MTGPEHYWEAQRIITDIKDRDVPADAMAAVAAAAQVHATLALAAAYAEVNPVSDWRKVAADA